MNLRTITSIDELLQDNQNTKTPKQIAVDTIEEESKNFGSIPGEVFKKFLAIVTPLPDDITGEALVQELEDTIDEVAAQAHGAQEIGIARFIADAISIKLGL